MKNTLDNSQLKEFYRKIANGSEEAFEFICLWSIYTHKFDDLVDEEFNVTKLIETNNELAKLLTCEFFKRYSVLLLSQIYLAAESYQASETTQKDTLTGVLLSHEGNNMLRIVALITGSFNHLVKISKEIRTLTFIEHPLEGRNINSKALNPNNN